MKKFLSYLLAICFAVSLSACANQPVPTQPPLPTETQQPTVSTEPPTQPATEPAVPAEQLPMHSVSVPITQHNEYAQDGTLIFTHTYQELYLIVPDPAVAEVVTLDFMNRVDASGENAASILSAAQSDYSGQSYWNAYSSSTIYNPTRMDAGILSLYGTSSTYNGGAHPSHISVSANYDLLTGAFLELPTVLQDESSFESIYQLLISRLESIKQDRPLFRNYAQMIHDTFQRDFAHYQNWYFSDYGIHFFFSPYEIAPYATGIVDICIPYSGLVGVIKDEYFPPELIYSGEISAILYKDSDTQAFTQISDLVTDRGGEKILLHTGHSAVSHITIEYGTWVNDATVFSPVATVYACSTLTPGDAILIETYLPDTLPTLRLNYLSAEQTVSLYITQSGEDGSILLTKM